MLNQDAAVRDVPKMVDYGRHEALMAGGRMNTDDDQLLANIRHAVRLGHPQMRAWPPRAERVCLVGSGPSLAETADDLRRLVWDGAIVVTLNGAYHWCIDHGLRPNTQIVMDARATNARFVVPEVPHCRYVLASQCHPDVWAAVAGRPEVWIWHAVVREAGPIQDALDAYYLGQWMGVGGGTTVATRAVSLLRQAGYVRFDLFGVDCCWLGGAHHAVAQPENDADRPVDVLVGDATRPETMRRFTCSLWQLKQLEDFLLTMKLNGSHFTLDVHGDGMLAYIMRTLGDPQAATVVRADDGLPLTEGRR